MKPPLACVPSQYGLFFDCPQRQSPHLAWRGNFASSRYSRAVPSESAIMVCLITGTPPETRYGPFLLTFILLASSCAAFTDSFSLSISRFPRIVQTSSYVAVLGGYLRFLGGVQPFRQRLEEQLNAVTCRPEIRQRGDF